MIGAVRSLRSGYGNGSMTVAGVATREIVRGVDDRPAQANLDILMAMPAMSTGVRRRDTGGRPGIKGAST